jgi:hypothetical protein
MARKVIKKGEAPKVEVVVADIPAQEVGLTWKEREHPSGMREWTQKEATEDSRDLSIHWFNDVWGHTVTIERAMSTVSHFATSEQAMAFCVEIVRGRRTPKARKAAARRAASS